MVSVATTTMGHVTENASPHPHHVVQKPRKRTTPVEVADFTMLVKVPGQPEAIKAFTDDEAEEARKYAADTGGTVVHYRFHLRTATPPTTPATSFRCRRRPAPGWPTDPSPSPAMSRLNPGPGRVSPIPRTRSASTSTPNGWGRGFQPGGLTYGDTIHLVSGIMYLWRLR